MEQIKKRPLFGGIGKRGIPGRRPYPAVLLIEEVLERRLFAASVAPILASSLVEPLRKSFGQAVRESVCHNRIVIVVFFCKSCRELIETGSCGHGKRSDVVHHIRRLWGDKVGQRLIELAGSLSKLLTERMKSGNYLFAGFIGVQLDVIADSRGGPETVDAAGVKQPMPDDFGQELLSVSKQFPGPVADDLVFKYFRIRSAQFPDVEKRRPIYKRNQFG